MERLTEPAHAPEMKSECCACEGPLLWNVAAGVCSACGDLVAIELAWLLETVGPLAGVGTPSQVEDVKRALSVLYASTSLGTNSDRIAAYLELNRSTARQYGMRYRAAKIWVNGEAQGPWTSTLWLSPAFCRLMLMDALVGAGLAVRGKNRWDFLLEEHAA